MSGEGGLTREIQLALASTFGQSHGLRVFRNNVGVAHYNEGELVRYGLAVGSSDLIGWVTVCGVAVFLAVEVKTARGRATLSQIRFLETVRKSGGIGVLARSVDDAINAVRAYIDGVEKSWRTSRP